MGDACRGVMKNLRPETCTVDVEGERRGRREVTGDSHGTNDARGVGDDDVVPNAVAESIRKYNGACGTVRRRVFVDVATREVFAGLHNDGLVRYTEEDGNGQAAFRVHVDDARKTRALGA